MEEQMSHQIFTDIWSNLSEVRQKELLFRIKETIAKIMNNKSIGYDSYYEWRMNAAFDKSDPIQYVYVEGLFSVEQIAESIKDNPNDPINRVHNIMTYIQVSENVDDMLDRSNEMNNEKGNIYNFNALTNNNTGKDE